MPSVRITRAAAWILAAAASMAAFCQKPAAVEPRPVAPRGPLQPAEQAVVKLFETAAPSVAYLTTEGLRRRGLFFAEVAQGAGSGFVVSRVVARGQAIVAPWDRVVLVVVYECSRHDHSGRLLSPCYI